jgi:hypothetical protein
MEPTAIRYLAEVMDPSHLEAKQGEYLYFQGSAEAHLNV